MKIAIERGSISDVQYFISQVNSKTNLKQTPLIIGN
jgi:hypothetical protein